MKKYNEYSIVLQEILPHLDGDAEKSIMLEVLSTLILEGLVSNPLNEKDIKLLTVIYQSVLASPEKRDEALSLVN